MTKGKVNHGIFTQGKVTRRNIIQGMIIHYKVTQGTNNFPEYDYPWWVILGKFNLPQDRDKVKQGRFNKGTIT